MGFFDAMLNPIDSTNELDDFEAIHSYLSNVKPQDDSGKDIRKNALLWFDSIGDWDKQFNIKENLNQARSWRNMYDVDQNAELARKRFEEGYSLEEAQGKHKPYIDPKTGQVGEKPPLIDAKYKIAAVVGVILIGVLTVLNIESAAMKKVFRI